MVVKFMQKRIPPDHIRTGPQTQALSSSEPLWIKHLVCVEHWEGAQGAETRMDNP